MDIVQVFSVAVFGALTAVSLAYTLLGVALALNMWGLADRVAAHPSARVFTGFLPSFSPRQRPFSWRRAGVWMILTGLLLTLAMAQVVLLPWTGLLLPIA
jgi:hypothetical protein